MSRVKWAKWVALAVGCLCLSSCGMFDAAQQLQLAGEIARLEDGGLISESIADAMLDLVEGNGVGPIWQQGLGYGLAALSAYLGVQWRRGTPATKEERICRKRAKLEAKLPPTV